MIGPVTHLKPPIILNNASRNAHLRLSVFKTTTNSLTMSSPPHTHTPLPPLANPRKRPSISSSASAIAKRQQLHPLRQTSFPTPGDGDARIFSATTPRSDAGSITASLISNNTNKPARGRGRPRKDGTVKGSTDTRGLGEGSKDDSASVSQAHGGRGASRGAPSLITGGNAADEDPDDDEAEEAAAFGDTENSGQEIIRDQWKYQVLEDSFSAEQKSRYEMYRRVRFPKQRMQKIVNQTLSQSVTAPVVTFVNGYTKYFVGEIIEKARDVQEEWARAWDAEIAAVKTEKEKENKTIKPESDSSRPGSADGPPTDIKSPSLPTAPGYVPSRHQKPVHPQPPLENQANPHKGPIIPDHLREALRRYKADGEGGGVGLGNLSLHGMGLQGEGVWRVGAGLGGRRLFR